MTAVWPSISSDVPGEVLDCGCQNEVDPPTEHGKYYVGSHRLVVGERPVDLWQQLLGKSILYITEQNTVTENGLGRPVQIRARALFARPDGTFDDDYYFCFDGTIDDTELITKPYNPQNPDRAFLRYTQRLYVNGRLVKTIYWEWRVTGPRYDAPPGAGYNYYWTDVEIIKLQN